MRSGGGGGHYRGSPGRGYAGHHYGRDYYLGRPFSTYYPGFWLYSEWLWFDLYWQMSYINAYCARYPAATYYDYTCRTSEHRFEGCPKVAPDQGNCWGQSICGGEAAYATCVDEVQSLQ